MKRKVLLIEPNYKNKYPPIGLMKISTYYKAVGDDVRFYKGDMKNLAAELTCEDLIEYLMVIIPDIQWKKYTPILTDFIKVGKYTIIENDQILLDDIVLNTLKEYRKKFKNKEYFNKPRFDKVCITTLFTFYWDITVDTINFAKQLCKKSDDVMVGGIMSTLLPNEIYEATGIHPHIGLLNKPGDIDNGNKSIIDQLPLDYSILDEIEYIYPANNAYFAYMTRGCINHCSFCAVPTLEPKYCDYIGLKQQIDMVKERFGEQRDLLLLDNNVLASNCYEKIIDEIKECGYEKGATYTAPNQYEVTINNLKDSFNDRAYIRRCISIYKELIEKLKGEEQTELYLKLENAQCLYTNTATKEAILELDEYIRPLYAKTHRPSKKKRIVDFNQGVDARLINDKNMEKLSEINIYPLRIAFDHWGMREIYENAVRTAVKYGIKNLSNYMLYNFKEKPEDLYYRMRLNIDLCEELDASIYSFPMKYLPINDPRYFKNRDYIGEHWNRKFIRAIQAVLNSTKGKIGKGLTFFNEAFGSDIDGFYKILWMPETFIIYRMQYKDNLTEEWWNKFCALSDIQLERAKSIIVANKFKEGDICCTDKEIIDLLSYYQITRDIAEKEIKK